MDAPEVHIEYSCHGCEVRNRELKVRERGPDEDVVVWMRMVQLEMSRDHESVSPSCPTPVCDLKIPMPNKDARIGAAIRQ